MFATQVCVVERSRIWLYGTEYQASAVFEIVSNAPRVLASLSCERVAAMAWNMQLQSNIRMAVLVARAKYGP